MTNVNMHSNNDNVCESKIGEQLSNIQKVRQLIKILNTGNLENVENLIHDEYFNHESHIDASSMQSLPENISQQIEKRNKLMGPSEFIDTVKSLRNAFTDLTYDEKEIHSDNNTVIGRYTVSGKHTGQFFIFPPTGHNFRYEAVHIYRFQDGKIREHKAVRDDLSFMYQLGFIVPTSQYESLFRLWKGVSKRRDDV
ncbi:ester cyclase [Candidatus Nitrosocosmicus franklandus]|uniref:Putative ester cyclase n=1 Tax=Candidatus Nitrosocosmicus franklandianus TaxID=1798806 RepID=A0A484I9Q1_9ARCH|nr:ester cyclase [Candidatus Nitrosocosmicus franklandus]VFJ13483.1 putative ester cyclase [Candidatus Nitrosocosmicus franklandus]